MASLEQILASLQLEKYTDAFTKNEIDLASAKLLSEKELEEVGLAMGPRKKLYAYFHPAGGAAPAATTNAQAPAAPSPAAPAAPATSKCGKISNIMAWDWCHDSKAWYAIARLSISFSEQDGPGRLLHPYPLPPGRRWW
jgi:hypothetical protein